MIVFGAVGLIIVIFLALLLKLFCHKCPNLTKKALMKLTTFIFNSIHQTFNNAALPILITTTFGLKGAISSNQSWSSCVTPLLIILVFMLYPILVFRYLNSNLQLIVTK